MLFNRTFLAVSLYYSIIFMCGAVFTTYISLYYALIELTHTEVGWLSTVGAVVALLVQPMWGIASDRAKTKNKMLALSVLLSALTVWLIPLSGDMIWLLVLTTAVFTAFQCATHPLSDTITLELASRQGFTFSSVRTIGSLGFAIASAIAGFLFEDDITLMFPVYSVMLLFCLLCSLTIPPVEGHQSGKQKMSLSALFRNKKIVVIYLYTITIQSTIGFFFTFHAIYSYELGISAEQLGLSIMVSSFSQFPFMIFFDFFYRKFGIYKILLFSGFLHAVRWFLYANYLSESTIVWLSVLHGGTFILFYMCIAEFVNRHVADPLKASGQMMNSIVLHGVTRIFGGLLGGYYAAAFGIRSGFTLSMIVCLTGIAAFAATLVLTGWMKENGAQGPASASPPG